MTDVPELLGIPILPEGAFPNIIWIFKVLFYLIIIVINNYLYKQENSGNQFQNDWDELSREVKSLDCDISQPKNSRKSSSFS